MVRHKPIWIGRVGEFWNGLVRGVDPVDNIERVERVGIVIRVPVFVENPFRGKGKAGISFETEACQPSIQISDGRPFDRDAGWGPDPADDLSFDEADLVFRLAP